MPKKILLLRFTPVDGNPNQYNTQEIGIGKAFCRLGYDYDHICFRKNNQRNYVFYEYNGCKARYIELPRMRFFRMGFNKALLDKEFLNNYDIIICREYYQIMSYLISQKHSNVSLYSGPYWNMFMLKFTSPIYDWLFTKSINRNMKSKFVKSDLAKIFLEKKGYTNVINVGVGLDMEKFEDKSEIEPSTQAIVDYMTNFPCILFVGTICDNKNFPLLLDTYKLILNKNKDVKFVIIGKSEQTWLAKLLGKSDESYMEDVLVKYPTSLIENIMFVQEINNSQLKFIYPLAKAFLLPSKHEIFGMVLLEAMYLGAPVVTSINGGSVTLIGNDGPGQIVSDYNPNKWADAVMQYISNPDKVKEITHRANMLIKEQYNWDSIAQKMLFYINKNG